MLYFFLYPAGHLGATALTFLIDFPFVQVIVISLGVTATFGAAKILFGAAVIFTGTMSLNAGELCAITQFFNLKYFPISEV
jgi:hypothetical protein